MGRTAPTGIQEEHTVTEPVLERFLTDAEERQLMHAVRRVNCPWARRDAAWMALMRQTGVRVRACSLLTVADARDSLRLGRLLLRADIQKRRHAHTVPLTKRATAAIRELLAVRRALGLPQLPDAPLVVGRGGRPLSVRSFQARMQGWRVESGLTVEASPHWFRHTLGQRLIARSTASNPLLIVQAALGHADIRSSAIYTRPTREDVATSMEEAA